MDASDKDTVKKIRTAIRKNSLIELKNALRNITDINTLFQNRSPLLLAAKKGNMEAARLLLTKGIDVNSRNMNRQTALIIALESKHLDVIKLLLEYKADVNLKENKHRTKKSALSYSVEMGNIELVKLLLDNNADVNCTEYRTALSRACYKRNFDVVKCLVNAGADCNIKNMYSGTPLCISVNKGDINIVKFLVEAGADIDTTDNQGYSPLCISADRGNIDISKILVEAGADLNNTHSKGCSPLCISADKGNLDIAKILVEAGADLNKTDSRGYSPLCISADKGNLDISKILVEAGADLNNTHSQGCSPLCISADKGNIDISKILVEAGADLNTTYFQGCSPLCISADKGNLDIAKILVEAGADLNKTDSRGFSPLCISADKGNIDISKILVEGGADLNNTQSQGCSPLCISVDKGNLDIAKILVEAGADLNIKNSFGDTPLCITALQRNIEFLKYLLQNDASVNKGKSSPLYHACDKGYIEITKTLIEFGADLNLINNELETALIRSVTNRHIDIVKILLDEGADINYAIISTGETALLCAARRGHSYIVNLLLQYGSDVNKNDKEGNNALKLALNGDHIETVKILLQKTLVASNAGGVCALSTVLHLNETNNLGQTPLMLAAIKGFYETVFQLKIHSYLYVFDLDGNTAFMLAAKNGHLDIVELLYEGTVDVNLKGQNALMLAAIGGHVTVVELLISKGFDVNKTDHHGNTALMLTDNPEVVGELLKHRADVNVININGRNALMELLTNNSLKQSKVCIKENYYEWTKSLLNLTADINVRDNTGETAIIHVLKHSQEINLINLILDRHPDLNVHDHEGNTPLMIAVQYHNLPIIERILLSTDDVNKKNNLWKTAIMMAAEKQNMAALKILLSNRYVNNNVVDSEGNSLLMLALQNETDNIFDDQPRDIVQELLRHGADVNHVNNKKTSVLMLAVQKGFIPAGIYRDIDMGDSEGKTALMYALEKGHFLNEDVVRHLLEHHKANVYAVDITRKTMLMYAVETWNIDVVRQLLEHHKINVNAVDIKGETALIKAVKNNSCYGVQHVKILLENKANIYIQDKKGRTALMWAVTRQQVDLEIIQLLLEAKVCEQNTGNIIGQVSVLDQTDNKCKTALMLAFKITNFEVLEYLLKKGLSTGQKDEFLKNILKKTVRSGEDCCPIYYNVTAFGITFHRNTENKYKYICRFISSKKNDLNYFNIVENNGDTLLMLHAKYQHYSFILEENLLFTVKQNINAVNKHNKTALMISLEKENDEFIRHLCKLYKEDDVVCPKGRTLLMMASQAGLVDTVKDLVKNGSNINKVDKRQRTALMYVVNVKYTYDNSTFKLIEYLLSQGADVNKSDYQHESLLIKILKQNSKSDILPIIKLLLDNNAQTIVMDQDGRSPLIIAILQLSLINTEIKNTKPKNEKNEIIKQLIKVVHLLLEKTDDVNTTDNKGNTALMLASKYGFNDVVQILINKTDDINRVNKKGQTAYDLALKNGHYSVVQTLVENKANVNTNDVLEFAAVFSGLHNVHQRSVCLNNGTRDVELWTAFLSELDRKSALATNKGENSTSYINTSGLNTFSRHKDPNQDFNSRIINFQDLLNKIYEQGVGIILDVLYRTSDLFKDDCFSVTSLIRMLFLDVVKHGKLEECVLVYAASSKPGSVQRLLLHQKNKAVMCYLGIREYDMRTPFSAFGSLRRMSKIFYRRKSRLKHNSK